MTNTTIERIKKLFVMVRRRDEFLTRYAKKMTARCRRNGWSWRVREVDDAQYVVVVRLAGRAKPIMEGTYDGPLEDAIRRADRDLAEWEGYAPRGSGAPPPPPASADATSASPPSARPRASAGKFAAAGGYVLTSVRDGVMGTYPTLAAAKQAAKEDDRTSSPLRWKKQESTYRSGEPARVEYFSDGDYDIKLVP